MSWVTTPSRRSTICQAKALTTAPIDSGRMIETSITICTKAPRAGEREGGGIADDEADHGDPGRDAQRVADDSPVERVAHEGDVGLQRQSRRAAETLRSAATAADRRRRPAGRSPPAGRAGPPDHARPTGLRGSSWRRIDQRVAARPGELHRRSRRGQPARQIGGLDQQPVGLGAGEMQLDLRSPGRPRRAARRAPGCRPARFDGNALGPHRRPRRRCRQRSCRGANSRPTEVSTAITPPSARPTTLPASREDRPTNSSTKAVAGER